MHVHACWQSRSLLRRCCFSHLPPWHDMTVRSRRTGRSLSSSSSSSVDPRFKRYTTRRAIINSKHAIYPPSNINLEACLFPSCAARLLLRGGRARTRPHISETIGRAHGVCFPFAFAFSFTGGVFLFCCARSNADSSAAERGAPCSNGMYCQGRSAREKGDPRSFFSLFLFLSVPIEAKQKALDARSSSVFPPADGAVGDVRVGVHST